MNRTCFIKRPTLGSTHRDTCYCSPENTTGCFVDSEASSGTDGDPTVIFFDHCEASEATGEPANRRIHTRVRLLAEGGEDLLSQGGDELLLV